MIFCLSTRGGQTETQNNAVFLSACFLRSRVAKAMHFTLDRRGVFVYAPQAERQNDSVAFRQLRYGFGTYFAYKAPIVPTVKVIE